MKYCTLLLSCQYGIGPGPVTLQFYSVCIYMVQKTTLHVYTETPGNTYRRHAVLLLFVKNCLRAGRKGAIHAHEEQGSDRQCMLAYSQRGIYAHMHLHSTQVTTCTGWCVHARGIILVVPFLTQYDTTVINIQKRRKNMGHATYTSYIVYGVQHENRKSRITQKLGYRPPDC